MNIKSEKLRNTLLMLSLILSTMAVMGDMVVIPVAGNIFETYADVNVAVLNFFLSGPVLIGAVSGLVAGKLMQYISKKKLLIVAFGIFSIGAIFGNAIHSAYYMVGMRMLVGIGIGMVGVIAMAIIADVFVDENKRSTMMGIFNGGMAAVGAILGAVSGVVATMGWETVFSIYLATIPVLIMILLFVPADKLSATSSEAYGSEVGSVEEKLPWGKVLSLAGSVLIYNIVYCIVFYQISMIVIEKGIGDVALIGTLSALGTVGSFLASFSFGSYYKVLKRVTPVIGYSVMALSYGILYFSTSSVLAMVACTLMGATFGMGMSYFFMHCTMIVPESKIPMSIAVTNFAMSIGGFLSVYVATMLQSLTGAATITEIMPVLIGTLAVGAVISAVLTIKDKKLEKNQVKMETTK